MPKKASKKKGKSNLIKEAKPAKKSTEEVLAEMSAQDYAKATKKIERLMEAHSYGYVLKIVDEVGRKSFQKEYVDVHGRPELLN